MPVPSGANTVQLTDMPSASPNDAPAGGSTVLVVDDNRVVRQGLRKVLAAAGYQVETAANGVEGLLVAERRPPAAIVCDIMMPVMDGMRFFERLAATAPELTRRVLFVTAWADDAAIESFLERSGQPTLQKPFEVPDLLRAVKQVMGSV